MNIDAVNAYSSYFCIAKQIDEEELRIIKRLKEYGISPTFNKAVDKAKLHSIEIKEAKQLNYISEKFITVTKAEQEKIQEKKKALRKEINPDKDTQKLLRKEEKIKKEKELEKNIKNKTGATTLGEQLWLTIKMKTEKQ